MSRRKTALSRALVTLCTIVVGLVLLLPATGRAGDNLDSGAAYTVHTVRQGDTIWEIAQSVTSEGEDVRDTVASIRELNGLVTRIIVPGQKLDVPRLGRS